MKKVITLLFSVALLLGSGDLNKTENPTQVRPLSDPGGWVG